LRIRVPLSCLTEPDLMGRQFPHMKAWEKIMDALGRVGKYVANHHLLVRAHAYEKFLSQ